MLTLRIIVALLAVGVLARAPRSTGAALVLVGLAGVDLALGASAAPAFAVVAPLFVFLAAALALAASLERAGLADRAVWLLTAGSRGNTFVLYGLTCLLSALLTAVVSLDGAVVLMIPVLSRLNRVSKAPFAPLFVGVVTVANAASIAVPQGNPTNLVLMSRLHLSPSAFVVHLIGPGLVAATVCAAGVAVAERRALAAAYPFARVPASPLTRREGGAALSLAAAAIAGWLAPLIGLAPWWPFAGAVALGFLVRRERPGAYVPWRIAVQVGAILITVGALASYLPKPAAVGLPGLILVAGAVGAFAAIANNLPATASATTLLAAGPAAYAASIGLAVGALATPQGSVATLIASDLAGPNRPPLPVRRLAPIAAAATLIATALLWTTL